MSAAAETTARRAVPAWRQELEGFWRWWSGELAQLLPAQFGKMRGIAHAPVVSLEGDEIVLREARAQGLAELSRTPLASLDPEGRKLALRNLLATAGEAQSRLRLCLARDEALLRRVALPLATEENLAQVLEFEMDRLTPFRASDVYFGYRVAARDAATGKVQVDLAAARKDLVDAKLARLREWDANVGGVVLAEDLARSPAPINLIPDSGRGASQARGEGTVRNLAAAAVVVLLLIALVLPLYQKREAAIALRPVVEKAKQEAEATDALARQLEKQVADYNFLLSKKHSIQPALALIEELSRLLPDSTWVQQLDLRPVGKVREVQISGETTSSSKLIEIFEQATTLQNAAPRGTVTRGSQPGTERFLIAAEVKPRTLPESIPAAQASGAAPSPSPATAQPAPTSRSEPVGGRP